jgi:hypothetical protein
MDATQACMQIMSHPMKQTKFAAYQTHFVKVSQLSQSQYGQLVKEQHSVAYWNHILFVLNQSECEDDVEFEEVKTPRPRSPFQHRLSLLANG